MPPGGAHSSATDTRPPRSGRRTSGHFPRRLGRLLGARACATDRRVSTTFARDFEDVTPDIYVLGKALGGGIVPVSAVVARHDVLGVIRPGSHGSTFGGNPLAAAVGHEVVGLLRGGEYQARAAELGKQLQGRLEALRARRRRRPLPRLVGRDRHRSSPHDRAPGMSRTSGPVGTGQGHTRLHHSARPAPHHGIRGTQLDVRAVEYGPGQGLNRARRPGQPGASPCRGRSPAWGPADRYGLRDSVAGFWRICELARIASDANRSSAMGRPAASMNPGGHGGDRADGDRGRPTAPAAGVRRSR